MYLVPSLRLGQVEDGKEEVGVVVVLMEMGIKVIGRRGSSVRRWWYLRWWRWWMWCERVGRKSRVAMWWFAYVCTTFFPFNLLTDPLIFPSSYKSSLLVPHTHLFSLLIISYILVPPLLSLYLLPPCLFFWISLTLSSFFLSPFSFFHSPYLSSAKTPPFLAVKPYKPNKSY